MLTILSGLLLVLGVALMLLAAIGLIRLSDPLQRMHSATKAGTLGTTFVIAGVLLSGDGVAPLTGLLTIAFLLFTLPIGAQLLGRAIYMSGEPLVGIDPEAEGAIPGLSRPEEGTAAAEKGGNNDADGAGKPKKKRKTGP